MALGRAEGEGGAPVTDDFTLEGRFLWLERTEWDLGRELTMLVHIHATERDSKGNLRWLKADGSR